MNCSRFVRSQLFLAASFLIFQTGAVCRADDIKIEGTDFSWNDKSGRSEVDVKPGDVVTWIVSKGEHGLVFLNFTEAQKVLSIDPASLPIKNQDGFAPPAQGTDSTEDTAHFLVRATVKAIPEGMTEVPFICTLHDEMTGKLKLHPVANSTPAK
jgi:plastocyanin